MRKVIIFEIKESEIETNSLILHLSKDGEEFNSEVIQFKINNKNIYLAPKDKRTKELVDVFMVQNKEITQMKLKNEKLLDMKQKAIDTYYKRIDDIYHASFWKRLKYLFTKRI